MSNLSSMRRMRIVLGVFLAATALTVLISYNLEEPDLETAVASALAADDRLIEVALEKYPEQAPAIIITYGQLPLFREQLARFGPQVVPIVAAYQKSFTTADALQLGQEASRALRDFLLPQVLRDLLESLSTRAWALVEPGAGTPKIPGEDADPSEKQTVPEIDAGASDRVSPEDPGLIAPLRDWLESWSTLVWPGETTVPDEEQTPAESDAIAMDGRSEEERGLLAPLLDWLASWFTPAQRLVAPAADAPEITGEAADPNEEQAAAEKDAGELGGLSEEDRGLLALLNMDKEHNAFVGQWEITPAGEAKWVPSRVVILGGTELLIPGLTDLERRIVEERKVDWQNYGLALVDVAAIASGATLLRFAGRGMRGVAAGTPTLRSGALSAAEVLGIKAARYGLPIGLFAMMVLHPDVFNQLLRHLAEILGFPGIIGPLVVWGIVIVLLAFLLSRTLLSLRVLRFAGWLLAGAARGCRQLAVR